MPKYRFIAAVIVSGAACMFSNLRFVEKCLPQGLHRHFWRFPELDLL